MTELLNQEVVMMYVNLRLSLALRHLKRRNRKTYMTPYHPLYDFYHISSMFWNRHPLNTAIISARLVDAQNFLNKHIKIFTSCQAKNYFDDKILLMWSALFHGSFDHDGMFQGGETG